MLYSNSCDQATSSMVMPLLIKVSLNAHSTPALPNFSVLVMGALVASRMKLAYRKNTVSQKSQSMSNYRWAITVTNYLEADKSNLNLHKLCDCSNYLWKEHVSLFHHSVTVPTIYEGKILAYSVTLWMFELFMQEKC